VLILPPLDAVAELDATELPAVLAQLAALQAAVAARLASVPPPLPPRADGLLDVKAAAVLIDRSESWLRKHGRQLPGFIQPTGPRGRARWSQAALIAWRDRWC
jgi:hypothetical protein